MVKNTYRNTTVHWKQKIEGSLQSDKKGNNLTKILTTKYFEVYSGKIDLVTSIARTDMEENIHEKLIIIKEIQKIINGSGGISAEMLK